MRRNGIPEDPPFAREQIPGTGLFAFVSGFFARREAPAVPAQPPQPPVRVHSRTQGHASQTKHLMKPLPELQPNRYSERLENIPAKNPVDPDFTCPISLDIMADPITVSTGITYDRNTLIELFRHQPEGATKIRCPMTQHYIRRDELFNVTNLIIKGQIERFIEKEEAEAGINKGTSAATTPDTTDDENESSYSKSM